MEQKLTDNGIEWIGEQVETESQPLHSEGGGSPIILRTFEFELPPQEKIPTDKKLLEAHRSKILAFLWRDELIPVQEFKVVKSRDNHHFRIFATCQAKVGSVILEKPQLIQDIFNGKD